MSDTKNYEAAAEELKKAGLLLDSKGDSVKTKYIYDVLSNVNQKIAINKDEKYFKKLKEKEEKPQYKAGKLVIDFEGKKDDEFSRSFKYCAGREIFVGD